MTSINNNFVIPENPVDEHEFSDLCTDNEEFSDIFISKQKTERSNNNNPVNMDYSIKLDISKVIEEEESKLRESMNETIV